jgi:predicted esterase
MIHAREHHLRVARTARFFVYGEPATAEEVWFVLHGYKQLAERFIERFTELPGVQEGRRAVVAPEALNRFYVERAWEREMAGPHGPDFRVGATWMTRSDREHEIRDYVDYLDRLRDHIAAGAGRVVALGFSQGSETASRWAVLGAVPPAELILWGGGLAADLDPGRTGRALAGVTVSFVVGDEDAWAGERSTAGIALLAERGVAARRVAYEGGHRVERDVLTRTWP